MITTGGTSITPAQLAEVRAYIDAPKTTSININAAATLLELLDESIKLLGKACGGRFGPEDSTRCGELFKLIGHEP